MGETEVRENPSLEKFELLQQHSSLGTLKENIGRKILAIDDKYRDKRFRTIFGALTVLLIVIAPFLGLPSQHSANR